MDENSENLTQKQLTGIIALLANNTVTEAARLAGVSRTTVYTWLKDPEFSAELRRSQGVAIEAAASRLAGGLSEAVAELHKLVIGAESEQVKRLACSDWISFALRLREFSDLESRIQAIEERLK